MEELWNIDWYAMFVPAGSVLEPLIRGTIMYLGMFILLRIFRRQAGSISIADLLLIVIIADAAQNGMAGEAKSITEAMLLIGTIIFWDYFLDWLGFKSKIMSRVLEPEPVLLVKDGKMQKRNMAKEMLTEEELMSQIRLQGIDDIGFVKECRLESDGEFSVIKTGESEKQSNRKDKGAVN